jgi:hypothetical protein
MMDVLIRAKLWDIKSGEKSRSKTAYGAKLWDIESGERSRSETAYGAKLRDVESGKKSRSETAYVTIHRAFGAKKLQGFPKDVWAFDSGASKHMCHELNAFISYRAFDDKHIVELGDAHCISAHCIGSINLICQVDGQLSLQLTDVLYVPELQMNLISQRCLYRKGCRTVIDGGNYSVFFNNAEILRSTSQTDLYIVDITVCYAENDNDVVMSAAESVQQKSQQRLKVCMSGTAL